MSIYRTAVNKPVTTALVFIAFAIFGIFSFMKTSIAQLPDFDANVLLVMSSYPGASAADIETNLTKVLENGLNGVSDLKDMTSKSKENISIITLEFNYGVDIEEATNNVRDKLDMINSSLPDQASTPVIFKFSMDDMPILILSATADESLPGLDKILDEGFHAGHGESRPAKRIETAAVLACISMETVQNEMHGGQAIPAFDFYLAPYVRKTYIEEIAQLAMLENRDLDYLKNAEIKDYLKKDLNGLEGDERLKQHAVNMTVSRVHQAMEAFVHNMNTIHSRGGNQVVFSSINYGTDISAEGRCIIREILNTTYEGVGNGSTAIFPIQIWKKKRGVSYLKTDPNYDLYRFACKVSARRFFPNFLNLDATFNQSSEWRADDPKRYIHEVATMGCRTRVFENRFGPKTSIGRGNLSFTTINIVRIAIECMDIEDKAARITEFFHRLDDVLDITAQQLCERYNFQKTALKKQFPLLMGKLWIGSEDLRPEDTIESVINQGTLGIGFIGLAECLIALTGKHHGESEEAQELGLRIVTYMRDKANEYSEKFQHNFSVLGTPAEGLSGRFTKMDKKKFGIIKGVTDKEYYTNSSHVPVYFHCTPKHKAEVEAPYHDLERGGHIFYVEIDGDATHNPEAIMNIVDLMDKYNIGYGSVNHNRNRCLDCGYEDASENLTECPHCHGHNIDTLQRITGYLVGTTNRWNSAKLAELKDRVVHK